MKKFIIKLIIKYLGSHDYVVLDVNTYIKLCLRSSVSIIDTISDRKKELQIYPFTIEQSFKKDENTTNK